MVSVSNCTITQYSTFMTISTIVKHERRKTRTVVTKVAIVAAGTLVHWEYFFTASSTTTVIKHENRKNNIKETISCRGLITEMKQIAAV